MFGESLGEDHSHGRSSGDARRRRRRRGRRRRERSSEHFLGGNAEAVQPQPQQSSPTRTTSCAGDRSGSLPPLRRRRPAQAEAPSHGGARAGQPVHEPAAGSDPLSLFATAGPRCRRLPWRRRRGGRRVDVAPSGVDACQRFLREISLLIPASERAQLPRYLQGCIAEMDVTEPAAEQGNGQGVHSSARQRARR